MIKLTAPDFWYERQLTPLSLAASALSFPYQFATQIRRSITRPSIFEKPVICIGNVTVGGAGKTPLVLAIYEALALKGCHVSVVSRGYGGRLKGPIRVDPNVHSFRDTGDEPFMMAQKGVDVWISRHRPSGIAAAFQAGAESVILDDGFQNPTVSPSASVLVFDGAQGLGNERLFPAGPLREPLSRALERSKGVLVLGPDRAGVAQRLHSEGVPPETLFIGQVHARLDPLADLTAPHLAFCGVGNPEKVFESFRREGLNLIKTVPFPDHHTFSEDEIEMLCQESERLDAQIITTEKDFVRLPNSFQTRVIAIPAKIEIDGGVGPLLTSLTGLPN